MREDKDKIVHAASPVFKLDLDKVKSVRGAKENGSFFDADGHIEESIFTDISVLYDETVRNIEESGKNLTPNLVRKEIRGDLEKVFGNKDRISEIPEDKVKFRPKQLEFFKFYRETNGNVLLGLRTGEGKTTTYMHLVKEQLDKDPNGYVVVTTPKKLLRGQIIEGCIKKFGTLKSLEDQVLGLRENALESEKRLIIDTPQAVFNKIKNAELDPRAISLIVMDEGAIGSNSQTGDYDTFNIANRVSLNPNTRIIIADGTPIRQDFLEDQFDIKNSFYGEDPRFVSPTQINLLNVESNERHQHYLDLFAEKILKVNFSRMQNFLKYRPFLSDFRALLTLEVLISYDKKIPYLKYNSFDVLKSHLSGKIKSYGARYSDEKKDTLELMSCLSSFNKLQNLYQSLNNEDYHTVVEKIRSIQDDARKIKPTLIKSEMTLVKTLLIGNRSDHKSSPLVRFARELKLEMNKESLLHPKELKLKLLLEQINKEDKKVLIICDHIPTLDNLNRLINQNFNQSAFAIRGGSSKKNRRMQNYAIEQFNKGNSNVLIGTSVLERGLDLPALDYVISYSPSRNASTELQVRGRLRKGGAMVVLASSDAEKIKFYKNRRDSHNFFRERAGSIERQVQIDLENEEKESLKSKFAGLEKTQFFARDFARFNPDSINRTFSERFLTVGSSFSGRPNRFGNYVVKVVLGDRSGKIDYYYSFSTRYEAQMVYDEIAQKQEPVIVNGQIKFSNRGNVYLVGNHTPGYFIEGIIECPKEDVPYEQLGMIRPLNEENISPNTIALSDSTNQFHGVDMEQLSFRDYMRNNTDLETLQPTNDDEVVAAKIEVVVEDLVEETRQVVFDKHGQAKLPF